MWKGPIWETFPKWDSKDEDRDYSECQEPGRDIYYINWKAFLASPCFHHNLVSWLFTINLLKPKTSIFGGRKEGSWRKQVPLLNLQKTRSSQTKPTKGRNVRIPGLLPKEKKRDCLHEEGMPLAKLSPRLEPAVTRKQRSAKCSHCCERYRCVWKIRRRFLCQSAKKILLPCLPTISIFSSYQSVAYCSQYVLVEKTSLFIGGVPKWSKRKSFQSAQ